MASIDRAQIERVATLARLSLSDEEAEQLSRELASILDYAELLQELDTTGVEPTSHPIPLATPTRDDTRQERLDPERAVANAPEALGTAFVVPRVVDSEAQG